jgi:hypothetical protein
MDCVQLRYRTFGTGIPSLETGLTESGPDGRMTHRSENGLDSVAAKDRSRETPATSPTPGLMRVPRTVINRRTGMEPAQNEEIPSPSAKGRLAPTGP